MGDEENFRGFSNSNRSTVGRNINSNRNTNYTSESSEDYGPSRFRNREEIVPDNTSFQFVDLNDLPSERARSPSASITSMESYTSSILHLSERRASFLSTVPSIPSPTFEEPSFHYNGSVSPLDIEGLDYSGGPPLQTSLPETAALARLTCQQVDEMMTLVLAMIRRLDQLDERVTALLPGEVPERPRTPPPTTNSNEFSPSVWVKGAFFVALPIFVAAAVSYLRTGSVKNSRRR